MLHWLHSLLPHIPHYGYVLVFIVAFLNNLGFPLPGETILLGAGFVSGKTANSLWQPGWLERRPAFWAASVPSGWDGGWPGRSGKNPLASSHARTATVAGAIFQTSRAKTVFIARFIFLFPPVVVNLLAGMSKMSWSAFLFHNLTGSAAYSTTYILIGYFFGKKWKQLEAWLGPMALYMIFAGIIMVVFAVIFRNSVSGYWARLFSKRRHRK